VTKPAIEPSFEVIVSTYATQAAVALGQMPNPLTKKTEKDLVQAKFAIDLLQILEEKTKGNRTSEEDKFLTDCLYQLRMIYISQK
jgi:hypothetical protein